MAETRYLRIGRDSFPLGAFAGTDTAHPMIPDGASGTSCTLCFGWSTDFRHLAADIIPAPVLYGVKRQSASRPVRTAGHSR